MNQKQIKAADYYQKNKDRIKKYQRLKEKDKIYLRSGRNFVK